MSKSIFAIISMLLLTLVSCQKNEIYLVDKQPYPILADSLKNVYSTISKAAVTHDLPQILSNLDQTEAVKLQKLSKKNKFESLTTFLNFRYNNWPNLDTLYFENLIQEKSYARLSMVGYGPDRYKQPKQLRYTFLLFRQTSKGWKLSAISSIDKDQFDRYGTELTYHETDLPPKLRFPRFF